jgi:hypothetical protein
MSLVRARRQIKIGQARKEDNRTLVLPPRCLSLHVALLEDQGEPREGVATNPRRLTALEARL